MREAAPNEQIEKADFVYRSHGPTMEHNYWCAVCKEISAVQDMHTGILQPCWDCMAKGYYLRKESWLSKLWKGLFA